MPVPISPQITVSQILSDFEEIGIVGEQETALGVYIVGTSRIMPHPKTLSAIIRGPSSAGKSFIVGKVASLFPEECVCKANELSSPAIYNTSMSWAHKFVVGGERRRVQDDAAADSTSALRQLQSDGEINRTTNERRDGRWIPITQTVRGPISYVETTTIEPEKIFNEDLNRALLLTVDHSEEQSRAIMERRARHYCNGVHHDIGGIIEKHKAFQRSLIYREVRIPFAEELAKRMPATRVESRRIIGQVLSVIEVATILNQRDRRTDDLGRLISSEDDYATAAKVLRNPLSESLSVSKPAVACYTILLARFGLNQEFGTDEVQEIFFASDDHTVRVWLRELKGVESIELVRPNKGPKPQVWKMTSRVPDRYSLPGLNAIIAP